MRLTFSRPGHGAAALCLVCLAAAVAGCKEEAKPASLPPTPPPVRPPTVSTETLPAVKFVEITEEAGIKFVHASGAKGEKLLPETMGSGAAFLDYDGDGDQDLFLVNSCPWPGQETATHTTQALYRNDGHGHFEDVTVEARLNQTFYGQGVAVGDFDNDGDPDLFVTGLGGCYLYRNDGKGHFDDVTQELNAHVGDAWYTSAAFVDVDNDTDLDLFVCTYVGWTADYDRAQDFQLAGTKKGRAYGRPAAFKGTYNVLLLNIDKKFVDVSESAGIQVKGPDRKDPVAKSLGVAPYDFDGDGLVDLAVANDTVQNFLFHNLGHGKFEEKAIMAGMAYDQSGSPRGGMGIHVADFKNDGTVGVAVANFANEMVALYVNNAPREMQFYDEANIFGLGAPSQPPLKFGLFFFDYDLDGRLDLLSANGHLESDIAKVQASETYEQSAQLFWNSGKPGRALFVLVTPEAAGPDLFKPIVGRGSAYADIDGDGDLDVLLTSNGGPAHLFRNDGGNANHWIRLKLVGRNSNRDAIGAKVSVKVGKSVCHRQLFNAMGYLSSSELPLTFGLGKAKRADRVTITWPSLKVTELSNLAADKLYVVDELEGVQ
jgi:enediyne biosynthesis protein E4